MIIILFISAGKMMVVKVLSIARRKPRTDQLEQANPIRDDDTGFWQCPFCLRADFPELERGNEFITF